MKKRFKKLSLLSSLGLATIVALPALMSCKNELNFTKGEIVDLENDKNDSNDSNKKGTLSSELLEIENNNKLNEIHVMTVTNSINFVDYNLPATDENGVYRFIRDRGGLTYKNINLSIKQNVGNFLQSFNFAQYQSDFNSSLNNTDNPFLSPIPSPSNNSFLNDIYYWMISLYYKNDSSFDVGIENNIVNFDIANNTISFDITFTIKNVRKSKIAIGLFDQKFVLDSNKTYKLNLQAQNQPIQNIINIYNRRFFLGWQIPTITVNFLDKSFEHQKFNPTQSSNSFSYMIEFLNLTSETNPSQTNNTTAAEFMKNLNPSVIEKSVVNNIFENTNKSFDIFPYFAKIFNALKYDLTIGEFLYQTADPLVEILFKFDILPEELKEITKDILKSANTGAGLLDIVVKHKKNLSNTLKKLLSGVLGNLTDLVDTILSPIKPGMNKEEVEGFLKLLTMFFPDENDPVKQFITLVIKFLLGDFNSDGSINSSGNPYIFDLLDYLLSDNLKENLYNLISSTGLKIDKALFEAMSSIYKTLTARNKNPNGVTEPINNSINYNEKIISKLFDIKYTDNNNGTWWLMDQMIVILNALGIQVGTDNTNLIYELLNQSFANSLNRSHVNKTNVIAAINEIANAFIFLSNKDNFEVQGAFVPLQDGKNVTYDKTTFVANFNYNYKLIFKKNYTFNLDVIINAFPSDVFIEIYKLTGNEWITYTLLNQELKFYTRNRYVRVNLTRVLYRMLPKKLPFSEGDSFNMEYKLNNKKLLYSQNYKDGVCYHGFNSIIDVESYFDQGSLNKGIISNIMSNAWNVSDFQEINDDHIMDQAPPSNASGVVANIQYESGINKQSTQNINVLKEIVQKLFVNRMKFNINLVGIDETKVIEKPPSNDAFYKGNTFKWLDVDLNQEPIVMSENPKFQSLEFDDYWDMFKYTNTSKEFNYSYLSNVQGQTLNDKFVSQVPNYSSDDIAVLKNDLFTLGSGINNENVLVSAKPISNLSFEKIVNIKGGADITGIGVVEPLKLELQISVKLMMFQITVITPNKVLDLSSMTRNGDNYSLTSYNYSNIFDKTFFVPRIAIKMPNF